MLIQSNGKSPDSQLGSTINTFERRLMYEMFGALLPLMYRLIVAGLMGFRPRVFPRFVFGKGCDLFGGVLSLLDDVVQTESNRIFAVRVAVLQFYG